MKTLVRFVSEQVHGLDRKVSTKAVLLCNERQILLGLLFGRGESSRTWRFVVPGKHASKQTIGDLQRPEVLTGHCGDFDHGYIASGMSEPIRLGRNAIAGKEDPVPFTTRDFPEEAEAREWEGPGI